MRFRLWQLAAVLGATMLAVVVGGVVATWFVAEQEFREILDDDMQAQSELLADLLAANLITQDFEELERILVEAFDDDDEETIWVSVYADSRHVSNLPHALPLASRANGAIALVHGAYQWHGYQTGKDDIVVQMLRRDDLYAEVTEEILENVSAPALLGGVVNLVLLAILIALILMPVTRLERQLRQRSAGSLAPVMVNTAVQEIGVLRDSINELMSGIDTVVTRERQFASDVAHELRTPLTTLKLELASDDLDLAVVKSEVERLARTVEQLLILARLEQEQWHRRFDTLSLGALCERVCGRFREKFAAAKISLASRIAALEIRGDAVLLETLLSNLLQNVLRHCPAGTQTRIELETAGHGQVCLRVTDSGAGIAPATRRQMSREFSRLDSKSGGLGLGLAICQRIAAVHGGSISFPAKSDGSPGLCVEVRLPA
jgi:signal transduction histidine kinase